MGGGRGCYYYNKVASLDARVYCACWYNTGYSHIFVFFLNGLYLERSGDVLCIYVSNEYYKHQKCKGYFCLSH